MYSCLTNYRDAMCSNRLTTPSLTLTSCPSTPPTPRFFPILTTLEKNRLCLSLFGFVLFLIQYQSKVKAALIITFPKMFYVQNSQRRPSVSANTFFFFSSLLSGNLFANISNTYISANTFQFYLSYNRKHQKYIVKLNYALIHFTPLVTICR